MQIHPSTTRDKLLNKFINKFHHLLQWPTVYNQQSLCENNIKPPSSSTHAGTEGASQAKEFPTKSTLNRGRRNITHGQRQIRSYQTAIYHHLCDKNMSPR